MKLSSALKSLVIFSVIVAIAGGVGYLTGYDRVGQACSLLVLSGTLIGLIYYAYYTYLIASDLWEPRVHFELRQDKFWLSPTPYLMAIIVKNNSKQSVRVWVVAVFSVHGENQLVRSDDKALDGKNQPWDIEPGKEIKLSFNIEDCLKVFSYTTTNMEKKAQEKSDASALQKQMQFYLRLKYFAFRSNSEGVTEPKRYYIDFLRKRLDPLPETEPLEPNLLAFDPWRFPNL